MIALPLRTPTARFARHPSTPWPTVRVFSTSKKSRKSACPMPRFRRPRTPCLPRSRRRRRADQPRTDQRQARPYRQSRLRAPARRLAISPTNTNAAGRIAMTRHVVRLAVRSAPDHRLCRLARRNFRAADSRRTHPLSCRQRHRARADRRAGPRRPGGCNRPAQTAARRSNGRRSPRTSGCAKNARSLRSVCPKRFGSIVIRT